MEPWQRIAAAATRDFIRGQEPALMRNRKVTALMMENGSVIYNCPGKGIQWQPRIRENTLRAYTDNETSSFARVNRNTEASLTYRAYRMTEQVTKFEKLAIRSRAMLVEAVTGMTETMLTEIKNQFASEVFVDGYATGYTDQFNGLESMLGGSSANANMPIADSSDSYAGLSTVLGEVAGGSWSGNWPEGMGPVSYDCWTPLLVNYTSTVVASSTGWSSSTKTWPNTGKEAIRFAILYTNKNHSQDEQLDAIFTTTQMYRQLLDSLDDKERIQVERNGQSSKLIKLGFSDTVNIDGCDVTSEFGVPADTGYGVNYKKMELRSMQGQLFVPDGPHYRVENAGDLYAIDCYGNFRFKTPRNFVKFKNYG